MVSEMGRGIRTVKIAFENPVIVSQRFDEGLVKIEQFQNPKKAYEEFYPEGSFAYSQVLPMVLRFERPL